MTEHIPETFDMLWMQTMVGIGGLLRSAIPVAEALGVLQSEQAKAARGEYGTGVVVYLRPSGPSDAERLGAAEAALGREQELTAELTRQPQQLQRECNIYYTNYEKYYHYYEELAGQIMILAGREMDRLRERRDADAPPVRPQRLVTEGGGHETLDKS